MLERSRPLAAAAFAAAPLALGSCRELGVEELVPDSLRPTPAEEVGLWADAAGDVGDARLARLCVDLWELRLRENPVWATYVGDPRYHGRVADRSPRGRQRRIEELEVLERRAAQIDASALTASDRVSLGMCVAEIRRMLGDEIVDLDRWNVDPLGGPQNVFLSLAADQPNATERERGQLVRRWYGIASATREIIRDLRQSMARGEVASRTAVQKTIDQLDAVLRTHPMDSPLVAVAMGDGHWVDFPPGSSLQTVAERELGDADRVRELALVNRHLDLYRQLLPPRHLRGDGEGSMRPAGSVARHASTDGDDGGEPWVPTLFHGTRVLVPDETDPLEALERGAFLQDVLVAVEEAVYPTFALYREFLSEELLPASRGDDRPGLVHVPDGEAAYRILVRQHTTLELAPEEIHELGLQEVERVRAEIAELGAKAFGTEDFEEIQRRLRSDPELHFSMREEVLAKAAAALERAREGVPEAFARLPRAACEVVPVPRHEERDTTIAYYREPSSLGDRPGRYYVNTHAPTTRPRYEAEVLAFHESVPGHHLQIALAQELEEVPLVQRHAPATAFVEGWALYAERLADELGLYGSDLDRLGMLSYDAWRACRLVVDTGIHALGWTRDRAIEYLHANTLLARNNCENEVDRYIAHPGQALAYKLGQREIRVLRERAQAALGEGFDLPAFHGVVLEGGPVTLPILREAVDRWLRSRSG